MHFATQNEKTEKFCTTQKQLSTIDRGLSTKLRYPQLELYLVSCIVLN